MDFKKFMAEQQSSLKARNHAQDLVHGLSGLLSEEPTLELAVARLKQEISSRTAIPLELAPPHARVDRLLRMMKTDISTLLEIMIMINQLDSKETALKDAP